MSASPSQGPAPLPGGLASVPSLHQAKESARELVSGGYSSASRRGARSSRVALPDIDLSTAVPFPTKPSRVTAVAGWFRRHFPAPPGGTEGLRPAARR